MSKYILNICYFFEIYEKYCYNDTNNSADIYEIYMRS